jgi:hypothetical protein
MSRGPTYLTNSEGRAPSPSWDPLAFAVTEAHSRGLELHAWFNPYRAKRGTYSHASSYIAVTRPDLVYACGSGQEWLNPGKQEVMDYSLNVIRDVVKRYDIDAVHFDDYFYPYPESGVAFPDDATYTARVGDYGRQVIRGQFPIDKESGVWCKGTAPPSARLIVGDFLVWQSASPRLCMISYALQTREKGILLLYEINH